MADALVIGLAKKVKPKGKSTSDEEGADDSGDDKEMSLDEVEDSAVDDMIAALSGDKPDREAFKTGLRDFVKACVARDEGGEY